MNEKACGRKLLRFETGCSKNVTRGSEKVKSKVHSCTGRTAHRGSRGIALLFLDLDTTMG